MALSRSVLLLLMSSKERNSNSFKKFNSMRNISCIFIGQTLASDVRTIKQAVAAHFSQEVAERIFISSNSEEIVLKAQRQKNCLVVLGKTWTSQEEQGPQLTLRVKLANDTAKTFLYSTSESKDDIWDGSINKNGASGFVDQYLIDFLQKVEFQKTAVEA